MGYKELSIKIPVGYAEEELQKKIRQHLHIGKFRHAILKKSLDARNKNRIIWLLNIGVSSDEIKGGDAPKLPILNPERKNYQQKVLIVGSGPAGIMSAIFLTESGVKVTLIERGSKVSTRKHQIELFEKNGILDENNNYTFGEGGAGTFSDGKLTSRTKGISQERNYIFQHFINAGAPDEIMYMTHPHLGSDNLFFITQKLRDYFIDCGGEILFDTCLNGLKIKNGKVVKAHTSNGDFNIDNLLIACGHSAYDTYKLLIQDGVRFQLKNFAIGMRAEHRQEIINIAQWGKPTLPGVKAAEYRLSAKDSDGQAFYSFCMCPGGKVVPSTAYKHGNIVNGMSNYQRNSSYANAAVVVGLSLEKMLNKALTPTEALDWLEQLEHKFYTYSGNYDAPAIKINDFLNNKSTTALPPSSYPFGLVSADLKELFPEKIIQGMKSGLSTFCNKLRGYDNGLLLGLESKTSAPIQAVRHTEDLYSTYENLYLIGEGSGRSGGIVSSATDGLKVCHKLLSVLK